MNFNIMSALFVHQSPTCRKKSILAKVCFGAKRGSMWMLAKWIFIWKDCHLHLFRGCLPLNGARFGAK